MSIVSAKHACSCWLTSLSGLPLLLKLVLDLGADLIPVNFDLQHGKELACFIWGKFAFPQLPLSYTPNISWSSLVFRSDSDASTCIVGFLFKMQLLPARLCMPFTCRPARCRRGSCAWLPDQGRAPIGVNRCWAKWPLMCQKEQDTSLQALMQLHRYFTWKLVHPEARCSLRLGSVP